MRRSYAATLVVVVCLCIYRAGLRDSSELTTESTEQLSDSVEADEHLPWAKVAADGDPLKTKYPYVCHAEVNAVLNANSSVRDTTVYVSMFPCNECAKVMIQAGVKQVVFFEGKDGKSAKDAAIYAASRKLLAMAGVELRQHCPQEPIVHDFTLRCKKEQAPTAEEAILLSPVSPAPLPSGL